jgi:regulator of PEP synthase PpsR (kinase-PPPase family)
LKESRSTDYVDPRLITDELMLMKNLCTEHGWQMIDVTRRSVEETAASIMNLLADSRRPQD